MPTIGFTPNLRRHVDCPGLDVAGDTVRAALEAAFAAAPPLRGYLLDDQGRLRKHVNIFVDGVPLADRVGQSDPVGAHSEIYVFQALSGG